MLASILLPAVISAHPQTAAKKADVAAPANAGKPEKKETTEPSKADVQQSQKLFQRAMRLTTSESTLPEAFGLLEESTTLNPSDVATATAREFVKQELVSEHMERGNAFMETSHPVEALAEFREALALDPTNNYATQRVNDASALESRSRRPPPVFEYGSEPVLAPKDGKHTFTFRGDSRQFITNIAQAFGITVTFDGSFAPKPVKVDLENVDFYTALNIACKLSHCFYVTASPHEMVIANDTQDVRRNLERMSLRTFYVPVEPGGQALPEVVNILRTMLDLRFLTTDVAAGTITIRAPKNTLDQAAFIIENMTGPRPQVLLEIRVLRLDQSASKQIGISYPLQFTLFNLDTEARKLGPNAVDIINRFRAGTATAQDLAAAAALLASGGLSNSVFSQGFALFGGGLTTSGVTVPGAKLNFHTDRSLLTNIEHVTLRASQGQAATFRVGDRYPVLTGSFSSILSAIPGAGAAQGALQPIVPSFSYEDLGITLKATPEISMTSEVTLQLELAIKALGGTSINNIPTISNREYKGTITVRDGETTVMAGSVDRSETKTVNGVPWLSSLPGFGRAFSSNGNTVTSDQMLLLVTPHILQLKPAPDLKTEMPITGN